MDTLTWVIIAAFYAPLHYLVPLLITFFRSTDRERRERLRNTALDCTLSMSLGFILVIWLAQDRLQLAMGILFLSMLFPYLRLLLVRESGSAS